VGVAAHGPGVAAGGLAGGLVRVSAHGPNLRACHSTDVRMCQIQGGGDGRQAMDDGRTTEEGGRGAGEGGGEGERPGGQPGGPSCRP
jgi:hypothetical protein